MTDVTVVAATHNRADRLVALLNALRAQTLGRERFDVVIVDDASGDDTARVLAAAQERGFGRRGNAAAQPAIQTRHRGLRAHTTWALTRAKRRMF